MAGYILDLREPASLKAPVERVIAEGYLDTGKEFVPLRWVVSREDLSKVKGALTPPPREGRQSIPPVRTLSGSLAAPVRGTDCVKFPSSVGEDLAGRCAAALHAALSSQTSEGGKS